MCSFIWLINLENTTKTGSSHMSSSNNPVRLNHKNIDSILSVRQNLDQILNLSNYMVFFSLKLCNLESTEAIDVGKQNSQVITCFENLIERI